MRVMPPISLTMGEEALIQAEINVYDLIILDLNLPKIDGIRSAAGYETPVLDQHSDADGPHHSK
jgi:DNA-binding response OmpR family regulator